MSKSSKTATSSPKSKKADEGWTEIVNKSKLKKAEKLLQKQKDKDREPSVVGAVYVDSDSDESNTMFDVVRDLDENLKKIEPELEVVETQEINVEKEKKKRIRVRKPSLAQATSKIDTAQTQAILQEVEERYPSNYEIQLKALAEHFETLLTGIKMGTKKEQEKKTFSRKVEIPLVYLPEDVQLVLNNYLSKIPYETLTSFYIFLLNTITEIATHKGQVSKELQGSSAIGLKMLLQLIVRQKPTVVVGNLPQIKKEFIKPNGSISSQNLKTLLWTFAQLSVVDPVNSILVWTQIFSPLLSGSDTEQAVIEFLYNLLESKENLAILKKSKAVLLTPTTFEPLMVLNFSKPSRAEQPQTLLQLLYPTIQQLALFHKENTPHIFFPVLISHAATENNNLRQEVLHNLAECIKRDKQCLQVWLDLYPNYIPHSNNLILYILQHWQAYSKAISNVEIAKLMEKFSDINQKILNDEYVPPKVKVDKIKKMTFDKEEVRISNAAVKTLQNKVTGIGGLGIFMILFIFLLLLGAVLYFLFGPDRVQAYINEFLIKK